MKFIFTAIVDLEDLVDGHGQPAEPTPELIEAALRAIKIDIKDLNNGQYPLGIVCSLSVGSPIADDGTWRQAALRYRADPTSVRPYQE